MQFKDLEARIWARSSVWIRTSPRIIKEIMLEKGIGEPGVKDIKELLWLVEDNSEGRQPVVKSDA